jgi:hypothetical protein
VSVHYEIDAHGMRTLETGEMVGGLDDYASGDWRSAQR